VSSAAALVDRAFEPLDSLRRRVLRLGGPLAGRLSRDRALRVAVLGSVAIAIAFAMTALVPLWLLALGPIVLGVPHLLADVRYLVVRPKLHTRGWLLLVPLALLVVAGVTARFSWGMAVVAAAALLARGTMARKLGVVAVAGALAWASWRHRGVAELAFAHAHNAVAVAIWWAWRPRSSRLALVPLGVFLAASLAIASGALDAPALASSTSLLGTSFRTHLAELTPRSAGLWGPRLVLLFAFAQSVHYAVWLRLVPEDDRPRPAPRSFASSFRALRADLGLAALALVAILCVGLAAWATLDLRAARIGYLRFAAFHGYLELGALALCLVERVRPGACASSSTPA
jgi:hypothetical protein